MESWLKISCVLCIFGFLRELRPSEPYHAEILMGEWYHVTQDQVNRSVYPVGTYSYLALLIFVFLITDLLRYKPVIIANAITGICIWGTLIWTSTLSGLQAVEVFYGFYQAGEVAYYSYIYAKVDKQYYPRVTSHTRAAMFVGKLVAGILAQLVIGMKWMNYKQLFYISVSSQVAALLWAFFLPKVEKSLYFHNRSEAIEGGTKAEGGNLEKGSEQPSTEEANQEKKVPAWQLLWFHFRSAYTNALVIQWSLWYAISLAGFLQITTYMQVVWKSFENEPTIAWNGAVDVALTLLSAVFALLAGYFHAGRLSTRASLLSMALLSVLEGGCVLLSCWTDDIYLSYLGYVLYGGLFAFTITVASSELASSLEEDSFALVFGFNTFVGLLLQCILTLVVVSEKANLNLNVFQQFSVYAFYFIVIGVVYSIAVILQYIWSISKKPKAIQEAN
ncbi:thiamine transporter 2 [Drosophila sechellia]|uniref:GM26144 n=1 Tax=Drosophila sechellia TaxID=7238 RepID=B4HIN6_DROSE|nr:thiamine transporter 2 [Drosophila sechellia]EDW42683.1 GM26144 [Drosophila sechellia]